MEAVVETSEPGYLTIRNLVKQFGAFVALKDIALDVSRGEFVCFLGPSGCGKTTLLRAIAGLDIQTSGTVIQDGRDISALPPSERDFGIVFQSYALFPNLSVTRNVAYGLENSGLAKAEISDKVNVLLKLVGLPDQGPKYPAQLSGGQQQRVALARALATSPGLLLLDEPLSALDAKVRVHLRHEIKALQERIGVTTIMVTHDQEEALALADRIVVMNHGLIEQIGTPGEIYREPATLFVADFIGEMNQIEGLSSTSSSVKVGARELSCQPHAISAGARAIMTIRPEDILLNATPPDDNQATANQIMAEVADMEFLGSFWRVTLAGEDLGVATLTADVSIDLARRLNLAPGGRIHADLPAERVRLYPAGGAVS